MKDVGLFDVIGPWMVGPSSSHTAGACQLSYTARKIFKDDPETVRFVLYGSFANTYRGHGTDRALLGGIMGFQTFDPRIKNSFLIAKERGIAFSFVEEHEAKPAHPNTVDITMTGSGGTHLLNLTGVSVGGGKIRITRLDGIDVNFTGEHPSLIITHRYIPGVISYFTGILGDARVNIVSMHCYLDAKGETAYSIIESDQLLSDEVIADIACNKLILKTTVIQ